MSFKYCCSCNIESDYGTSYVTGEGSVSYPYTVSQINPSFGRPIARVGIAVGGSASIPNNTPTAITFNYEYEDGYGMWSPGLPTRLTIIRSGVWLMGYSGKWAVSAGSVREVYFRANGVSGTEFDRKSAQNSAAAIMYPLSMNYAYYFSVDEYVEVVAFQTSGGSLAINSDVANPMYFWMMYVGRKV